MKKFGLLLLLLAVPLALFGQSIDFFEMPWGYNFYLYPERQYVLNPAVLASLEQDLDDVSLYWDIDREVTRREETGGATGVFVGREFDTRATLSGARFQQSENGATRMLVNLNPSLRFDVNRDTGYSTAGENETVKRHDHYGSVAGAYQAAMVDGDRATGYYAYLCGYWDPVTEEFERTTNTADNGGEMYYSADPFFANEPRRIELEPTTRFGIVQTADGEWKGLGARLSASVTDTSTRYVRADTTGNGFADSLVTEETFETADYGNNQAFYDRKEQTKSVTASVYPAMMRPRDGGGDLILSGFLDLVDGSRAVSYVRTSSTDESRNVVTTGSLLSSGGVFAGVSRPTDFGAELRSGVRAEFDVGFRRETDVDAAGASEFDPQNTGRLPEDAQTDPDNGDVINNGAADLTIGSEIGFLGGLEWRIADPLVVFVTGSATLGLNYNRYRYFDTTTDTVWTEWTANNELSFGLGSDFGVQFTLPNGPFVTVSGSLPDFLTGTAGDNYLTLDPMPGSDAGESPGITSDKVTGNGQGFTVNVNVTVRR